MSGLEKTGIKGKEGDLKLKRGKKVGFFPFFKGFWERRKIKKALFFVLGDFVFLFLEMSLLDFPIARQFLFRILYSYCRGIIDLHHNIFFFNFDLILY